jgi:hypothetical protein
LNHARAAIATWHQTIGFDPRIAALGEDVIVRAVRDEAVASSVIGAFSFGTSMIR